MKPATLAVNDASLCFFFFFFFFCYPGSIGLVWHTGVCLNVFGCFRLLTCRCWRGFAMKAFWIMERKRLPFSQASLMSACWDEESFCVSGERGMFLFMYRADSIYCSIYFFTYFRLCHITFLFFLFSRLLSRSELLSFHVCLHHLYPFLILRSSNRVPILRCIWANDRDCEPGEPPVPADLRCGQAAGLHSGDRSRLLDHPHGLQHLVVQTPEEEERPLQQLCRHTQRSVYWINHTPWMLPCRGYPVIVLVRG